MTRSEALSTAAYLIAAALFILSLRGLSSQETARRGNLYGIVGMTIAIVATLTLPLEFSVALILAAVVVGGAIGAAMSARVGMTQMPELVALLHSSWVLRQCSSGTPIRSRRSHTAISPWELDFASRSISTC